tara:strand:- start:172 stop:993 length:822 start_codon:yes stop_codon:yes gene_type:complete
MVSRSSSEIPLFYWSEIKFIFKEKENYGDLLSKYLVEKISGKKVKWVHPKKQPWFKLNKKNYLAIGSIIHHSTKNSIVWGSGIIDRNQKVSKADFRAVRGPRTRDFLLNLGYDCPKIYGDPALLLPAFYNPTVKKKYRLGVIPHYHDFYLAKEIFGSTSDVLVINLMTMDVEDVTRQILSCEKSISSSLHGLIVSQAYNIPCVWVEFSKKLFGDGVKFTDYFESVAIEPYVPPFLVKNENIDLETLFIKFSTLPPQGKLDEVKEALMAVCPFN